MNHKKLENMKAKFNEIIMHKCKFYVIENRKLIKVNLISYFLKN